MSENCREVSSTVRYIILPIVLITLGVYGLVGAYMFKETVDTPKVYATKDELKTIVQAFDKKANTLEKKIEDGFKEQRESNEKLREIIIDRINGD